MNDPRTNDDRKRRYTEMVYQPMLELLAFLRENGFKTFIDDKGGMPVGINSHIGRRPVATCGNSDGDLQMLQSATAGTGQRFGLLVHHTDAKRELAYDAGAESARKEARAKGWTVVDVTRAWKVIYPPLPSAR